MTSNRNIKSLVKKLELSEKKFRTVAETATDAIIITDQNSIVIFCNSKVYETFGYTKEELTGQNLNIIIPPEYRNAHKKGQERFLHTHEKRIMGKTIEIEALKKSGSIIPIELSLSYWVEAEETFFTGIIRDITKRKKEEQLLKESESKFRLLAENSSDVISINNSDGVILYISPSCKLVLGYATEELIGRNAYDLYHPDDLAKMKKAYDEVLDIPDIYTVLFRIRKKEGNYIWLESTARTIKNEQGKLIEIHAVNRDVTQRILSEEKLRESQHFIEQVTDFSPTLISVLDLINKTNIYANKEITDILGYSPFEIQQMGSEATRILVHPADMIIVDERNQKLSNLKDNEILESEFRVKHADGNYRWLYTRTTVFKRTDKGSVWQTLSTSIDITERKAAEEKLLNAQTEMRNLNLKLEEKVKMRTEALKQSENQLKIITNTVPAFISYLDVNGIYKYTNNYYSNLSFVNESPTGKHIRDVIGEEAYRISKGALDRALAGETLVFPNHVQLKDGSIKEVDVWYVPDKDEEGNVRGIVVMSVDLTERFKFEQELSQKNEELRKTNIDLDNFVYTASHDLKAPISNIEGILYSLNDTMPQECLDNPDVQLLLSMMNTSISKFKNTIQDLADITRVQKNTEEDISEIDVCNITDEIQFDLREVISINKAIILLDTSSCPTIKYSKKNLRSIIYNLLSNAIKYRSPNRLPEIKISTERVNNTVILSFKDNGLGIESGKIDKIFQMFKRLHDHVEGTGIGLYIVKRIVDNSGGRIEVFSELGKGTEFKIYFEEAK